MSTMGSSVPVSPERSSTVPAALISQLRGPGVSGSSVRSGGPPCARQAGPRSDAKKTKTKARFILRVVLAAQQRVLRIELQLFGASRSGKRELSFDFVGKDERQKARLAVVIHGEDRDRRHRVLGGVAFFDHTGDFDAAGNRRRNAYGRQREPWNGSAVHPAIKKPVERFLSFIGERFGKDLLEGALQVAGGDLVAGGAGQ